MLNNKIQSYVFLFGDPEEGDLELISQHFVSKMSQGVVQAIGLCGDFAEKLTGDSQPQVFSLYEESYDFTRQRVVYF